METISYWEFPKEVHVPIDTELRIRYTYDSDGKVFEARKKNETQSNT